MKKLLLTIGLILGFAATVPIYANNYYQMNGKPHTILPYQWIYFSVPEKITGKTIDTKHFICAVTSNYSDTIEIRYTPIHYIPNNAILNGGNIVLSDSCPIIQHIFNIKGMGGKVTNPYRQPALFLVNNGCNALDKNCPKNNSKKPKIIVSCHIIN